MLKIDQIAFNEGRKAFFRAADYNDNPYSDEQERQQFSWERGFETANREENDYDYRDDQ